MQIRHDFFLINESSLSLPTSLNLPDYLHDTVRGFLFSFAALAWTSVHSLSFLFIDIALKLYPSWIRWRDKQQSIPMPTLYVSFSYAKQRSMFVVFSHVYRFKRTHFRGYWTKRISKSDVLTIGLFLDLHHRGEFLVAWKMKRVVVIKKGKQGCCIWCILVNIIA